MPAWLPPLITLQEHGGVWEAYLEAIYVAFMESYGNARMNFAGQPVSHKRHPESRGKSATFWHLVSEGAIEEERTPDMRRCERILWPTAVIQNCNAPELKIWREKLRSNDTRVYLWCEAAEYLVILSERSGYVLLWTAYCVTRSHAKEKYQRRFDNAQGAVAKI